MRYFVTSEGQHLRALGPEELIRALHKSSWSQCESDQVWMNETAARIKLINGKVVRTEKPSHFVDDLLAAGFITEVHEQ